MCILNFNGNSSVEGMESSGALLRKFKEWTVLVSSFQQRRRRANISFHINLKTTHPNIICLGHHLFKISRHSILEENRRFLKYTNFLRPIPQIDDLLKDKKSIRIARYSNGIDGKNDFLVGKYII